MEALIILLFVLVFVVFPLWVTLRVVSLGRQNDALAGRLQELKTELQILRDQRPTPPPAAPLVAEPIAPLPVIASSTPPPPPPSPVAPPVVQAPPALAQIATPAAPPPIPVAPPPPITPAPPSLPAFTPPPPRKPVDWERFMGAKLFAWLGGLAAFLAAAFFVKYSFEHDLIPPEVRVAIGYLFALGLIVGGLKISRERFAVTAQTLIATGVVCLYGVTFACNSIYHFATFGPVATFIIMSLVTTTAFLLAVRLEAQVVAVLGILGGFLTPVLLSTGRDNPAGLFGYLALLDVGLVAVALHRRWHYLVALGALGTVVMQIGWAGKFLNSAKAPVAIVVGLAFSALFLGAWAVAQRRARVSWFERGAAIALPTVALGFAAALLHYATLAPGLWLAFVFAADACLLAIAWRDEKLPALHAPAGIAVFFLLAAWMGVRLDAANQGWALAACLAHAALHTAFPLVLERHRPGAAPSWASQIFPPLALLLTLGPLLKLDGLSLAFWPCVLLIDLVAVGLALVSASLVALAAVLVLTLGATAVWLFRAPVPGDMAGSFLVVVGAFAVIFFAAGLWLARRLGARLEGGAGKTGALFGDARAHVPAFAAILPFLLLIMMTQRLPAANPSPIFGLALLLTVLTLGLARLLTIAWLPACALVGVAALELAWLARQPSGPLAAPGTPLLWGVGFLAICAVFPFLFRARFAALTGPWAVAALAGVAQFPFLFGVIKRGWPNDLMGLLPAALALPPLASLVAIVRAPTADERARLNQLAWFGGAGLFFITLVFPIQFDRQWLTVAWALEGTALLWLFHRVPHGGLRATGVVLLCAAFARLALNPAVLSYHPRAGAILNWYLYAFGTTIACLFVGARLLAPPRERSLGINAPALLATLGTVLAFLLLNVEIADFFAAPGARTLAFEFSGNFARDMTYTIAWAVFALALLLVSFRKDLRFGRYAALALLGVALLKLFFHDLARLEALYRIGALFGVAVIAIVASFAYQRFLPGHDKKPTEPPPLV
ncbi:MAG: DUF2339 domain-containing protein [Opitutaceae bacterium]|nr:DUF2339 domain-containing protein [Opitutaceae bacterium]